MSNKGITFYNKIEANEYAKQMNAEGHWARITHPETDTWKVIVTKAKRRIFKPETATTKEVLDVGAGKYPAPRTTRAIDIIIPGPTIKVEEGRKLLKEYKQTDATKKIPYKGKFFDKVVSRWALGVRIPGKKVYKELARVLKPGGKVEVRVLESDSKYIDGIIKNLEDVGVTINKTDKHIYPTRGKKDIIEYSIQGKLA